MDLRRCSEIESARQVRRSVFAVRQKLLNPTAKALETCTPHLRRAIAVLAGLQQRLPDVEARNRGELRTELSALRRELREICALLESASAFHSALAQLLAPQADDSIRYSAKGIAAGGRASTMQVEG